MAATGKAAKGPRRWRRALGFRLAAVLLAVAPFALAEGLFVVLDLGRPSSGDDPFVGFSSVRPLFVPSADGSRYEIARSRQACFQPESFAARKAPDEYRIFCLGGSTVQGRPFAVETSFTTWLEINLNSADPNRAWQVVNCGGISYASYRLVPILREVLGHEPDLIVLYTGHNEFLEDREYGHIRDIPGFVARPCELLMETRTYNLLREACGRGRTDERPVLGHEADAMLDYKGGLEKYHRDETWRRGVIEHFRYNLRRMVQMSREAGAGVLLVNPVESLRNCPPFKSEHRESLSAEQLRRWEALCLEAGRIVGTNPFRAAELLGRASAIDDRHAGLHYLLGKCFDAMGRTGRARRAYIQAKELDVCPLRMLEPMHEAVLDLARRTRAPLVDVRRLIERRSRDGIPGGYLLLDHVHPSIAGHRLIADAITEELIRQGAVHPVPRWRRRRDEEARKHLASLDDFYFAKGQERLRAVRRWATGRATLVRPRTRPHNR
jgi:lysophospholipase L1-like esterase